MTTAAITTDSAVSFPFVGFLRLSDIIGSPAKGKPPIIPVGKSTWWAGVKAGRFPQAIKLGAKTTVWKASDIAALLHREGV
jgi:hypothetical protein